MSVGPVELLISTAVLLLTCLFPIATLVLVYLTYDKVRRIEERLNRLEAPKTGGTLTGPDQG